MAQTGATTRGRNEFTLVPMLRRGNEYLSRRVGRPQRPTCGWHGRTAKPRRLRLEWLEDRSLLSGSPWVGDLVWNDLNNNGIQDAGEPGIAAAVVEIFQSTDATVGNADDVSRGLTATDLSGNYLFDGLIEGANYYLVFRSPVGYSFTTPDAGGDEGLDSDANAAGVTAMFTLTSGTNRTDLDAGLVGTAPAFGFAFRAGASSSDYGRSIAVDAAGNVYVIGYFQGTADVDPGPGGCNLTSASSGYPDVLVAKYTSGGTLCWACSMGGTSGDYGYGIAVAADGSVYTTGTFQGTADFDPGPGTLNLTSAGGADVFVSKLDAAGHFVWARSLGGTGSDYGYGIALAADGSVCTTGYFNGTADFDPGPGTQNLISAGGTDVFVSKLDAAGNFVWAGRMGGTGSDYGYGIAGDADGSVCTTGYFNGTADFDPGSGTRSLISAGGSDIFVSKLDSAGNLA